MQEFFHMGGYALYVWSSYAIGLVVLLANVIAPLRRQTRLKAAIARGIRREQARSA